MQSGGMEVMGVNNRRLYSHYIFPLIFVMLVIMKEHIRLLHKGNVLHGNHKTLRVVIIFVINCIRGINYFT